MSFSPETLLINKGFAGEAGARRAFFQGIDLCLSCCQCVWRTSFAEQHSHRQQSVRLQLKRAEPDDTFKGRDCLFPHGSRFLPDAGCWLSLPSTRRSQLRVRLSASGSFGQGKKKKRHEWTDISRNWGRDEKCERMESWWSFGSYPGFRRSISEVMDVGDLAASSGETTNNNNIFSAAPMSVTSSLASVF